MHLVQIARVVSVQTTSGLGGSELVLFDLAQVRAGVPPPHHHPYRLSRGVGYAIGQGVMNVLAEWTQKKLDGFHLGTSLAGESWVRCWLLETHACLPGDKQSILRVFILHLCVCVGGSVPFWLVILSRCLKTLSTQGVLFITGVGRLPHLPSYLFPKVQL